jgi:SAM-dependent methyltransferase
MPFCGSGRKYKQCCHAQQEVPAAATVATDLSVAKAIRAAVAHHQAGRLPEAEALYRQILQAEPNYPDALHFLGILTSICYAMSKTRELGVRNIEYAQADIMKLGSIGKTFDMIESIGVLHHLAEPEAGWRQRLSLLRPGGFMRLGLYSERARQHVVAARKLISLMKFDCDVDGVGIGF